MNSRNCRGLFLAASLMAELTTLMAPAEACNGSKILFDDDFSMHDPSWGALTEQFEIKGGKATVKPPPNRAQVQLNTGFAFEEADICVTVTAIEVADPKAAHAGLIFWAKDYDNYYVFQIASNGLYNVARRLGGKWVSTIARSESDAIKQGPNQSNALRLTFKGQTVVLAINGKEVTRFRAQAPDGPSFIGVYAESQSVSADNWQFTNLKVTNVDVLPPRASVDSGSAVAHVILETPQAPGAMFLVASQSEATGRLCLFGHCRSNVSQR